MPPGVNWRLGNDLIKGPEFMTSSRTAADPLLLGGIPATNPTLYWRIGFLVGDPVALIEIGPADERKSVLILRDIEMERASKFARADDVACPADFTPQGGLSGDRETATAQAAVEWLRRRGLNRVFADRSLPLLYAHVAAEQGVEVICDSEWGVLERRRKREDEVAALREAQRVTEEAMRMACETVADSEARGDGVLWSDGAELTSERLRAQIDSFLIERAFRSRPSIVAGGGDGADCHNLGSGPLRTGESVIIDIFPQSQATHYNGDCTRTVVHGEIPPALAEMHAAVVAAKANAIAATKAGVTGEQVHAVCTGEIVKRGYALGLPSPLDPPERVAMPHGTGHGVGLEVHEPPLLDRGGPPLVVGDCLTIEPGLYRRQWGGVRVEDMVIVAESGCENLNRLPEGLDWA